MADYLKGKQTCFGWKISQVIVTTNAFGMGIDKAESRP
jgi:superfamily II DNA helicase RecQ